MHPPAVLAAPPASAAFRSPRAFTLLEVLLTIGLIALLAGVLVAGAAHLLSDKPVTADEVFWKAVQEARKAALKSEKEVRLRFDTPKKQFVLVDGFAPSTLGADGFTREETVIKQIPVP
ncbi:MAG TPA: type II secretion system protein, partial [Opitutaceae bacterium]|nr:type II secretion system protein [Opitutaceae bacterium]